jgi:hypothetical protein
MEATMKKAMLVLCALLIAGFAFAGDAPKAGHKWHKPATTYEFTGKHQFTAWTARTGDVVVPPSMDYCTIFEARLNRGPGFFAKLYVKENCMGVVEREWNWDVLIGKGGKVAMRLPDRATYTDLTMDPPVVFELTDLESLMPEHTGCPANGTFPYYYGDFDGKLFQARTNFHGVCTGGTMFGPMFGVNEGMGPLNVDFSITLEAID